MRHIHGAHTMDSLKQQTHTSPTQQRLPIPLQHPSRPSQPLTTGLLMASLAILSPFSPPLSAEAPNSNTSEHHLLLDRLIGTVNDEAILQSHINQRIAEISQPLATQKALPPKEVLVKQLLDRIILETLQMQMADQMGIRISDNELNDAIKTIATQNNFDIDAFQKELANQGIAYLSFREQIRRDMLLQQVQKRRVGSRIQVTEQDANTFLNSPLGKQQLAADYRIHHILITAGEDAKEKADGLYQELSEHPGRFEAIAARHSDGRNALEGGDLGWRPVAELPTLFSDQAISMSVGQIATPIKSDSGYHIIRLTDRRGKTTKMIDQLKVRHILIKPNEIRSNIASQQLSKEIHKKLTSGASFTQLAQTYSDDPGSARAGGDLGWVSPGQMVPRFEEVMHSTAVNTLSEPFETPYGWHILEVTDTRTEDFSDKFRIAQAKNYVYKRKFEEELPIWLREIRQDAFIEFKVPIEQIAEAVPLKISNPLKSTP